MESEHRRGSFASDDAMSPASPDYGEASAGKKEGEDDDLRAPTELVKERCPRCLSPCLNPHTEDGKRVIRCQGCEALLCRNCISLLNETRAADGRKILRCPKCGSM